MRVSPWPETTRFAVPTAEAGVRQVRRVELTRLTELQELDPRTTARVEVKPEPMSVSGVSPAGAPEVGCTSLTIQLVALAAELEELAVVAGVTDLGGSVLELDDPTAAFAERSGAVCELLLVSPSQPIPAKLQVPKIKRAERCERIVFLVKLCSFNSLRIA